MLVREAWRGNFSSVLVGAVTENSQLAWGIGPCQESTIQNQWLAGHKSCALRTHPQDGLRDLHRLSKAAQGVQPNRVLLDFRRTESSLTHRRFDHCGAHSIYPNPIPRIFECGSLRQSDYPVLTRAVRRVSSPTCQP